MNTFVSLSFDDLMHLRNALIIAKNHVMYNEKRCREMAEECSSGTLKASFFRGIDLSRAEYSAYQRLLNKLSSSYDF